MATKTEIHADRQRAYERADAMASGTTQTVFLARVFARKYSELTKEHRKMFETIMDELESAMARGENNSNFPVAFIEFIPPWEVVDCLTVFYRRFGWERFQTMGHELEKQKPTDKKPTMCVTLIDRPNK